MSTCRRNIEEFLVK